MTSRLSGVITAFTETEKQMVAVERESFYINHIPRERDNAKLSISENWPSAGDIEFTNVSLRYRDDLPLALRDVSLKIGEWVDVTVLKTCRRIVVCSESGEKIGVVGRTGSGKSSLLSLLFGIVDPCDGAITIDGANINDVPLSLLR